MALPVPEKLGKYQISGVLGEGAMGVVYKGFDPDIGRVVALKTIRRALDDGSDAADSITARFRNEARAAGRLQHPGIVAVYDFGQDEDVAFIAMEFVEGSNLSHYLGRKVRFTDEDILSVMTQLLDALEHAHEQGVWHRDIKPANLMMTRGGKLKVADFGIARIESAGLTLAGGLIGTPSYMAPEQFLGNPIDRRVDLYAAGVLLYQLLTGQQPFVGSTERLMHKVLNETPRPPSTVEFGLSRPPGYDAIVAKALAKDPEDRFANAAAFRTALTQGIGTPLAATVSDATVIAVPLRRPQAPADDKTQLVTRGSEASTGAAPPPTHFDAKALSQVEQTLARHVGPLAAVMVRRTARQSSDLPDLCQRLAEQVADATARNAFLEQIAQGASRSTGSASATRLAEVDPALQAKAEKLLAQLIGPIARVLVKKAASSPREVFAARLAEAINDPVQRQRFLSELDRL